MMQRNGLLLMKRHVLFVLVAYLLTASAVEFWNITWGTGDWLGQFSFKWLAAFVLFVLFGIFFLGIIFANLWRREWLLQKLMSLTSLRSRLGTFRGLTVFLLLITPVWILQYTAWGIILDGPYLRIMMWAVSALLIGILLTRAGDKPLTWSGFLASLTLMSGMLIFVSSLRSVTGYPFSLGWSEGNRMWDYSVLFGRGIYDYPADQKIPVLLDIGRQFVGGIPFILSGVTIWQVRLWNALVNVVPYLILGLIAFKSPDGNRWGWILGGIWTLTFVIQGPIHPPLLLCAIIVAYLWRKPLWLAIPLIVFAGYFASISRFTWLFAPGMWIGMLELSGAVTRNNRLDKTTWTRAISLGLAGVLGGYFAPSLVGQLTSFLQQTGANPSVAGGGGLSISEVGAQITDQPLLWYRLFPNATYGYGILIGLILAVAPLIIVLFHLSRTRRWVLNPWQKLAIVLPLLAFLVVGMIVSVKIGGGGDLHNMDMFIIGVMFTGAIAWRNGGYEWIGQNSLSPFWLRSMVVLLIVLPAFQTLLGMSPISIREDMRWVMILADIPPTGPLPEVLPSEGDTQKALNDIRNEVERAASQGDILFMDQRQLLTFGYVRKVPLIPEYDKKVLINQAMSADAEYFSVFYRDLAAQRFSLIITNPLNENIQTDLDEFGEENNAWVTWVSTPVLCYYEPVNTLKKVTVQLLMPRQETAGCEQKLPAPIP